MNPPFFLRSVSGGLDGKGDHSVIIVILAIPLGVLGIALENNDHIQGRDHTNDLPTPTIRGEGKLTRPFNYPPLIPIAFIDPS